MFRTWVILIAVSGICKCEDADHSLCLSSLPSPPLPFSLVFLLSPPDRNETFRDRRQRMMQQLCFLPASRCRPVPSRPADGDCQEIERELGAQLFRRGGRPAWGRLANLAGARMIWRGCAEGEGRIKGGEGVPGAGRVCLVLEDDAEFTQREASMLSSWWSDSPRECSTGRQLCRDKPDAGGCVSWDLLLLGVSDLSRGARAEDAEDQLYGRKMQWIQRPAALTVTRLCVEAAGTSDLGSHAYLVTSRGAAKLLEAPADVPTDVLIGRASEQGRLLAYVLRPCLVRQRLGCSTTEGTC
eukprot:766137-Hanusia_phi.AAC.4